jgi:ketosteroid isomerase-like protein
MKKQGTNMVFRVSIFLLLCGAIIFGGIQVSAEEWTNAQKEVWNSVKAPWEYFKQGDLEGFMTIYHDDAVEWWRNSASPLGKVMMKARFSEWLNYDKPITYELEPVSIQIFGNIANVMYKVKWKGNILSDNGRNMQTWIKQDNRWKFFSGMSASCDKPLKCE